MASIRITIDTDNAAFENDPVREIRRIFNESMREQIQLENGEYPLRDLNGNTCGLLSIEGVESE